MGYIKTHELGRNPIQKGAVNFAQLVKADPVLDDNDYVKFSQSHYHIHPYSKDILSNVHSVLCNLPVLFLFELALEESTSNNPSSPMSLSGVAPVIPSLLKKRPHFSVLMPDMSSHSLTAVASFSFPYCIEVVVKLPYSPESNRFISHGQIKVAWGPSQELRKGPYL